MTPAHFPPQQPPQIGRRGSLHFISLVLLALIVLVGLFVLITWLVIKPKRIVYTLEDASVHSYNLTKNNHVSAAFEFTLRAYNPNTRVSIYYDSFEVSTAYQDQTIAFGTVEPFHQPHENVTVIKARAMAQDTAISGANAKDLRMERSEGKIELDVYARARIRFKVGLLKSSDRTAKIECSPVTINFSSSKNVQWAFCEVDL